MILTRSQLDQLIAQAKRDAPYETCGMIGGKDGRALELYPLKNIHATPITRYYAEPEGVLAAEREIEDNGWEVLSIYHSHPATEPYPSPTDVNLAFYPDAVYILISLRNAALTQVRGYRIQDGAISEVTLEITEDEHDDQTRTAPRRVQKGKGGPPTHRAVAALSRRRSRRGKTRRARGRVSE